MNNKINQKRQVNSGRDNKHSNFFIIFFLKLSRKHIHFKKKYAQY